MAANPSLNNLYRAIEWFQTHDPTANTRIFAYFTTLIGILCLTIAILKISLRAANPWHTSPVVVALLLLHLVGSIDFDTLVKRSNKSWISPPDLPSPFHPTTKYSGPAAYSLIFILTEEAVVFFRPSSTSTPRTKDYIDAATFLFKVFLVTNSIGDQTTAPSVENIIIYGPLEEKDMIARTSVLSSLVVSFCLAGFIVVVTATISSTLPDLASLLDQLRLSFEVTSQDLYSKYVRKEVTESLSPAHKKEINMSEDAVVTVLPQPVKEEIVEVPLSIEEIKLEPVVVDDVKVETPLPVLEVVAVVDEGPRAVSDEIPGDISAPPIEIEQPITVSGPLVNDSVDVIQEPLEKEIEAQQPPIFIVETQQFAVRGAVVQQEVPTEEPEALQETRVEEFEVQRQPPVEDSEIQEQAPIEGLEIQRQPPVLQAKDPQVPTVEEIEASTQSIQEERKDQQPSVIRMADTPDLAASIKSSPSVKKKATPARPSSPPIQASSSRKLRNVGHGVLSMWSGILSFDFKTDNFLRGESPSELLKADEILSFVELGKYLLHQVPRGNRAETTSASTVVFRLEQTAKDAKDSAATIFVGKGNVNYFRSCLWLGQAFVTIFPQNVHDHVIYELPIEAIIKASGYSPDGFKTVGMLPEPNETWRRYLKRMERAFEEQKAKSGDEATPEELPQGQHAKGAEGKKIKEVHGWIERYLGGHKELLDREVPRAKGWESGVSLDINRILYRHLQNLMLLPPYNSGIQDALTAFKEKKGRKSSLADSMTSEANSGTDSATSSPRKKPKNRTRERKAPSAPLGQAIHLNRQVDSS